jgi:hypothetical protein
MKIKKNKKYTFNGIGIQKMFCLIIILILIVFSQNFRWGNNEVRFFKGSGGSYDNNCGFFYLFFFYFFL